MTDKVCGIQPVSARDRRATERRGGERRAGSTSRELVPTDAAPDPAEAPARPAPTPPIDGGGAVFAAQLIGQAGQRRGLKGGPPVMDAARSTYLGAEYSGPSERRPKPGRAKDTDV